MPRKYALKEKHHGTNTGYRYGCRCLPCTVAQREARKKYPRNYFPKEREGLLRAIKEASPCADCGRYFPYYIIEFDHTDGSTRKDRTTNLYIGTAFRTGTWARIVRVLNSGEFVCANCHRVRTWRRANGYTV